MGSGGKSNIGPLQIDWTDVGDTLANGVANLSTLGIAGVKDGKLGKGGMMQAADEAVGEITGRNLMRKQMADAGEALDKEAAQRDLDLKNKQLQDYRADVLASRSAQGVRDSVVGKAAGVMGATLGDEKDLLGL